MTLYSSGFLECDAEAVEVRVWGLVLYICIPDAAAETFSDVSQTIGNIFRAALCVHLYRAVGKVLDIAGQVISKRDPPGGEAKSYTLDPDGKSNMFRNISHQIFILFL